LQPDDLPRRRSMIGNRRTAEPIPAAPEPPLYARGALTRDDPAASKGGDARLLVLAVLGVSAVPAVARRICNLEECAHLCITPPSIDQTIASRVLKTPTDTKCLSLGTSLAPRRRPRTASLHCARRVRVPTCDRKVPHSRSANSAEIAPFLALIDSNRYYTNFGPLVRQYESSLVELIDPGRKAGCVTLSSGRPRWSWRCARSEIGEGRRVLIPALTFPATAHAVQRAGASLVVTDVSADTWTMTPAIARDVVKHMRCDLVIPVAAYGLPLPTHDWETFARDTAIPVVIDAAGALGTQSVGKRVDVVFSMHATSLWESVKAAPLRPWIANLSNACGV